MTPVCTDTPNSARKPTPEETLKLVPVKQKGEQAANGRDGNVGDNQQSPFEGFEHGVKNDEDNEDGDGEHDEQPRVGTFLAGVFSLPIEDVSGGQFDLFVYFFDRLFHRAAEVTAADAVLDSHIAAIALAIDFGSAIRHLDLTELCERYPFPGGR